MIQELVLISGLSGITIFVGGLLANFFNHHITDSPVKYEITHTTMSFGAGLILAALTLVLIPKGMEELDLVPIILVFLSGAISFMFLDKYLQKKVGQTSTLLAMMMDFLPESIILGAFFSFDPNIAILLAVFIGLQNLPEAFNAFRDLVANGFSVRRTLIIFLLLSFFGIIGALLGHFVLSDRPILTALLITYASGGILYLLIQDLIPQSKLDNNFLTPLGASIGFLIGIIGEKLVSH